LKPEPAERQRGIKRSLLGIAGFIALILGLFAASLSAPKQLSKEAFMALGYYPLATTRQVTDFHLLDENGDSFGPRELLGKWSLLFFGYTHCPDICPVTLARLNETLSSADENLVNQIRVILVTVDPERDSPEILKAYVGAFNSSFNGLSGEFDQVVALATQLNIAFGKVPGDEPGTYQVDHSGSVAVVNPQGLYVGFVKSPVQPDNLKALLVALIGR
jgi:protein SCO1/2